jgi:hypothetical protein
LEASRSSAVMLDLLKRLQMLEPGKSPLTCPAFAFSFERLVKILGFLLAA